jgi:hypothetical protein
MKFAGAGTLARLPIAVVPEAADTTAVVTSTEASGSQPAAVRSR